MHEIATRFVTMLTFDTVPANKYMYYVNLPVYKSLRRIRLISVGTNGDVDGYQRR